MIIINTIYRCPCCSEAELILKVYNIDYKKNIIKQIDKNKYKKEYHMETFPQIFYKNRNNKLMKIGGLSELKQLISICTFLRKYKYSHELINYIKRFTSDC
jgi:glutaredoxin